MDFRANPLCGGALRQLTAEGVSPWLAGTGRESLATGLLARLVAESGIRGASSDVAGMIPAVAGSPYYADQLTALAAAGASAAQAVSALLAEDARRACDELRDVFEQSQYRDGFVSVDLDPGLANDTAAIIRHAHELSAAVDRPNLLVKIPASDGGLTAIRACLADGIGVHATGIFSARRHQKVLDTHLEGLEQAHASGIPLRAVGSVAALPVGLLDREVDDQLDELDLAEARALRGEAALATARLMYAEHEDRLGSERWRVLRGAGAQPQRLMWSVADGAARGSVSGYLSALVGWGTVSELDPDTAEAFAEHGSLTGDTLTGERETARAVLARIARLGISADAVRRGLDDRSAAHSALVWRELRATVAARLRAA